MQPSEDLQVFLGPQCRGSLTFIYLKYKAAHRIWARPPEGLSGLEACSTPGWAEAEGCKGKFFAEDMSSIVVPVQLPCRPKGRGWPEVILGHLLVAKRVWNPVLGWELGILRAGVFWIHRKTNQEGLCWNAEAVWSPHQDPKSGGWGIPTHIL